MKRHAFTLVELLAVIAIIGLLSTVAVLAAGSARDKAAVSAGMQFEKSVHGAVGSELLADWEFDEGSGTTASDASGYGRSAALVNGPAWRCASSNKSYTPSEQGCSLNFNGSGSYVSGPALGMGDGTISIWFNNNVSALGSVILGKRTTGCFGSAIYIHHPSNVNGVTVYNAGPEIMFGVVKPNQWAHLAIVRANGGAQANFYLNGSLVLRNAYNLNLNDLVSTIGSTCSGANPFRGMIDNVRVYGAALGAESIRKIYAKEIKEHRVHALASAADAKN